jgi:aryl-alcohol dehydrogenase-like predicted oxidoreductase/enamine deaminase RidA (YjgF/YER057c/UK114 family)
VTGLWQVADQERLQGRPLDPAASARYVLSYAQAGCTSFDMADHYGSAEEILGSYLADGTGPILEEERVGVQVFTKYCPKPGPITREIVQEGVGASLHRLGVECIDLLQFHWWDYSNPGYVDALLYIQEMQQAGQIKHIGLTNFDTAHLRVVLSLGIKIVSNQCCFSLLDTRACHEMGELCAAHGVSLLAFGTVAGGFLSEAWMGKPEPTAEECVTWSQSKYKRFVDAFGGWALLQRLLAVLKAVADKHGVGITQVGARWVLQQRAVAAVIIGARLGERNHCAANRKVFGIILDEADLCAIAAVLAQAQRIPGDCGDEYRKAPFLTATGDLSDHLNSFPSPFAVRDCSEERGQAGAVDMASQDAKGGAAKLAVSSGTSWEGIASFSRAVRRGKRIYVSGTTATHGDIAVGVGNAAAQTTFTLDKVEASVRALGGTVTDIVRTRVYVRNLTDWEPAAREHGRFFADCPMHPANTLVQAGLVGDEYLVEIEADAELD